MVATSPSCGGSEVARFLRGEWSEAADLEGAATVPERITPPLYIGAKKIKKKVRKNLRNQNKALYLQCLKLMR